jgi:oligopeptide/dipeptide ABC transporter ATP-binding protein
MALLTVSEVTKHFPIRSGVFNRPTAWVQAVNGVSFTVAPGETLGIVGESGCGKSTLARLILRLYQPDSGSICFEDKDIVQMDRRAMKAMRREMQMVFQDPFASLNPRMTIGAILAEPFTIHLGLSRRKCLDRVAEVLDVVGLPVDTMSRFPHEFSGGQRQRIGIARAIALRPKLIVADEPVSALDVSVQGEILNLLIDLQERLNLAYIFIAHDLKVVAQISHRIAVMYLGRIVETLDATQLFEACHPYTRALLAAVPEPDPERAARLEAIVGDVPSPIRPPSGCAFHPRCTACQLPHCGRERPELVAQSHGGTAACHYPIRGEA